MFPEAGGRGGWPPLGWAWAIKQASPTASNDVETPKRVTFIALALRGLMERKILSSEILGAWGWCRQSFAWLR
jgi:hypothetical protein